MSANDNPAPARGVAIDMAFAAPVGQSPADDVIDFVKALARANAARDMDALIRKETHREQGTKRRTAHH